MLHKTAEQLAEMLQARIDRFAARPVEDSALDSDVKTIAGFARAAAAIVTMRLREAQLAAASARLERDMRGMDDDRTAEGDDMPRPDADRSSSRVDPEYVEQVREAFERRFCELAERLESKGLVERIIAVHDRRRGDGPEAGAGLAVDGQPRAKAA